MNKRVIWSKEMCLQIAQTCKTKQEFRKKYPSAYYAASRMKWLSEYQFLSSDIKLSIRRPSDYWTKERCIEESKKFKSFTEFSNNSNVAYSTSLHKGWLNGFTWLNYPSKDIFRRIRKHNAIYAYVFEEQNTVYVGRTNNINRRDKEHHLASEKYDVLKRFCKQHNTTLPVITILENNVSFDESLEKETFYKEQYRDKGYKIINREIFHKTEIRQWTYEACLTEAKKYKYAKDFQKSRSAYNSARLKGWLNDYTWLVPSRRDNYWNKETCEQEARKYSSRNEFRLNAGAAYRYALKNGWINEYTWLKRPEVWNKGRICKLK